jgi:hypothetical protein
VLKPARTGPVVLVARSDDWSDRKPIPPSVELAALKRKANNSNGGIRREPELH